MWLFFSSLFRECQDQRKRVPIDPYSTSPQTRVSCHHLCPCSPYPDHKRRRDNSSDSEAVAVASWRGLSGALYPAQEAQDASTPVAAKGPLVLCRGELSKPVPMSADCWRSIQWLLQDELQTVVVPLQWPLPSLLFTNVSPTSWGTHLQLTVAVVFSSGMGQALQYSGIESRMNG